MSQKEAHNPYLEPKMNEVCDISKKKVKCSSLIKLIVISYLEESVEYLQPNIDCFCLNTIVIEHFIIQKYVY